MDNTPVDQLAGRIFGPHLYTNATHVGRVSEGITAQIAFDALRRYATPLRDSINGHPVETGETTFVPGLRYVQHYVFEDRMTVVNMTFPGHLLDPGNVLRSVVQRGDDIYIVTEGYGVGLLPDANRFIGRHWYYWNFGSS